MTTATLDTNLADDVELVAAAGRAGVHIIHTTVTDRELSGSGITPVEGRVAGSTEFLVLDESPIGSVLASDSDELCFEAVLKIISSGSFPPPGQRDAVSPGQRRQLRDAMIFCIHVRDRRDIFITDDKKGFIDGGRRAELGKRFGATIHSRAEFLSLCARRAAAG